MSYGTCACLGGPFFGESLASTRPFHSREINRSTHNAASRHVVMVREEFKASRHTPLGQSRSIDIAATYDKQQAPFSVLMLPATQHLKQIDQRKSADISLFCVPPNDVPSRAKNPESSSYWSAAQRNGQASHWQSGLVFAYLPGF